MHLKHISQSLALNKKVHKLLDLIIIINKAAVVIERKHVGR